MRKISDLMGLQVQSREIDKLKRPIPPDFMFHRTSPKAVNDFDHTMDDIRLDNFHDDLLPSPEELKVLGQVASTPLVQRKWFRRTCFVLGFVSLMIALTLVLTSKNEGDNLSVSYSYPSRLPDTIYYLLESVNHDRLTNTSSPEFLAARWIADEDGFRVPFGPSLLERYALAVIWFATKGDGWRYELNFLEEIHHCQWHSTFQRGDTSVFDMGVQCNGNDEVTSLILQAQNLKGTVPADIALLSRLEHLSLDQNNLTGMETLRHLSHIAHLTLNTNQFTGKFPAWLGEFSNLQTLGMSKNKFTSTLPTELRKLKKLTSLSLAHNKLRGKLDVLEGMFSLEKIYLEGNAFTGNIDSDFLKNHERIEVLDLSNNDLSGMLDRRLLLRPKLEVLDLSGNSLNGSLPDFPHRSSIKFLALRSNFFTGTLPTSISRLSLLYHLDVSDNRLSGDLNSVETIQTMTSLQYLLLGNNRHLTSGSIPVGLRHLTALKTLSLKATSRTGPIPSWISELRHLELLNLDKNGLNSTIPSQLGSIADLSVLVVSRNKLTGTVPVELRNLKHLNVFILDENNLSGNVDRLCIMDLPVLISNCDTVRCECCTMCCTTDKPCLDRGWTDTYDQISSNGYSMEEYDLFTDDVKFAPVH